MELICDLIFSPIFWFLLAKLNEKLPKKVSLFLGSLLFASISASLGWLIFVSPYERDLHRVVKQATVTIPIIFIVVLLSSFFGVSYFQTRSKKHFNQDQLMIAKHHINRHKYQKALDILATIDDPEARDLENEVCEMAVHDPDFLRQIK